MGTTLTGTTPQDTYDSLIKVTDNGPLSGTAKYLSDGLGNDSVLALSTSRVGIGTTSLQAQLHIDGTTSESSMILERDTVGANAVIGQIKFTNNNGTTTYGTLLGGRNSAGDGYSALGTGVGVNLYAIEGGNVGIGTSTASRLLTLKNNAGATNGISFQSLATTAEIAAIECNQTLDTIDIEMYSNFAGNGVRFLTGTPTLVERARFTANGLCFNGDTLAANALDDYEEGTFTPTVSYSTSGTPTYAVQNGVYTKIGRSVQVQMVLSWNENGAVGNITIQGLPFASVGTYRAIPSILSFGLTGLPTAVSVTGIIFGSSTAISLFLDDNAGTTLTEAYTDNDQDLYVTVTYQAA